MRAIKKNIYTNAVRRLLERRDRIISARCREHLARPIQRYLSNASKANPRQK